ncbi:MAG TPA: M20/M25/M40 family metallo-hydrolase, partial [Thermomicrobiales bacterium]|nr:M20/M25/M40 family metallo-hydrolase [Thermomicrobiales bacterium]
MSQVEQPTKSRPGFAHPGSLVLGLVLMAAALALAVLAARPPTPRAAAEATHEFSADRAVETLVRLLGDEAPHPMSSEANSKVGERIIDELTAMGYPVETQTTFSCREAWAVCGDVTNIMTRLPGTVDGPAVLLTAHYDSIPAGPGAGDDMAGVATILEVARLLRTEPPVRNPIIFLFSDGEELGLLGAEAFMVEHPWAADVGVVVNLEANGTHGQSVLFQTTGDNGWLIDAFATHAPRPVASSVYDTIYAFLPFNTDLTVYAEAGLPGLNFAFIEEHPHYHTPRDNAANLDPGSVQHQGDNALAATRALASLDLSNQPAGRSVYQDLLPGVVVRWPEPWTIWLAVIAALVWIGIAANEIRRGHLSGRSLAWGLVVAPVGILGATLLGFALTSAVIALTGAAIPWYA